MVKFQMLSTKFFFYESVCCDNVIQMLENLQPPPGSWENILGTASI